MAKLRVLGGPLHGKIKDVPDGLMKIQYPVLKDDGRSILDQLNPSEPHQVSVEILYKLVKYERSRFRFPHAGREIEVLVPEGAGDSVKEMYLIQLIQGG